MQLTRETNLSRFVGGQIEVQNDEKYHCRGQIEAIQVDGEGDNATLIVELEWVAQRQILSDDNIRWIRCDDLRYRARLLVYGIQNLDQGRLGLSFKMTGDEVVLYPKDEEGLLDRSEVVEL